MADEGERREIVTAAVLAIGDELLSGRTKDRNIGYIAEYLTAIGVDVREARIVPDVEDRIVAALNALRADHDYVLTTGGIGPTHDDITADAVARAFGVGIDYHPEVVALLRERYEKGRGFELNEARMRMARIPEGGELIVNKVSGAPGFRLGNVFVMAGVPAIMQAMLDEVVRHMRTGRRMHARTVESPFPEGDIAADIAALQDRHDGLSVGSYPFFSARGIGTNVVLRSRDEAVAEAAAAELADMLARRTRGGS